MATAPPTVAPGETPPPRPRQAHIAKLMLGRLGRRILWRFLFFAVLALLIIIGTIVYTAWRQLEDARSLQSQLAQWAANSLDAWLIELDYSLMAAAQNPRILDASPEEMQRYLSEILLRSPAFRSTTLVDGRSGQRGLELMTLSDGTTSTGANLYRVEWFYPALDRGNYISEIDFVGGVPTITVARVVQEEGEAIGVVAAQADLSWALRIISSARTEKGGYVYVIDGRGNPILHEYAAFVTDPEDHNERVDIEGIHAAILSRQPPSFYTGLNEEEQQVIGDYRRPEQVEQAGWIVLAEQPLLGILRDFLPLAIGAGGVILLSGIAALVVSLFISRHVGRPVVYLQEGAQRIGTGDLDHRIVLRGHDELTDLAEEFNRMGESLQSSLSQMESWSRELEERVTERTEELSQAFEQLRKEATVRETLLQTIREMSSPVIPVMKGIIVTPIVGTLDPERAQRVVDDVLAGIEHEQARIVIVDITGLAVVDTVVANALLHTARAAQLLGAQPILVGISPAVAETLVQLGVDIRDLHTAATLQEGLRIALHMLHWKIVRS